MLPCEFCRVFVSLSGNKICCWGDEHSILKALCFDNTFFLNNVRGLAGPQRSGAAVHCGHLALLSMCGRNVMMLPEINPGSRTCQVPPTTIIVSIVAMRYGVSIINSTSSCSGTSIDIDNAHSYAIIDTVLHIGTMVFEYSK